MTWRFPVLTNIMRAMTDDPSIEPSSLEYIEDSYYPKMDHNLTPSLDELTDYDYRLGEDEGECEWSEETEQYLRSLTLDQILQMPEDMMDDPELQTVETEFSPMNRDGIVSSPSKFKLYLSSNRFRWFTKKKMRDVRVTFVDFSKPYLAKISSGDNYKRFLNIGSPDNSGKLSDNSPVGSVGSASEAIDELAGMSLEDQEKQRAEWSQELARVEEEIQTLRTVLQSKVRHAGELKKKMGISVWSEITGDMSSGIKNVKDSNVYQAVETKVTDIKSAVVEAPIYHKTESVLKATAEKTSSMFSGFTSKISQMKNSESFKSFEERVGGAYENVKTKVSTSRSGSIQDFQSDRNSTAPPTPTIHEEKPIL